MRQSDIKKLPDGMHSAAPNLALWVRNGGQHRSWVFTKKIDGKQRRIGLGGADVVTLAMAVRKADEIRAAIAGGTSVEDIITPPGPETEPIKFKKIWREALRTRLATVQATEKTEKRYYAVIERYALPLLGNMALDEITVDVVSKVLEPIWSTTPEAAKRVRSELEVIFDYCAVKHLREGENPAVWKGRLSLFLPPQTKVRQEVHHPAFTLDELRQAVQGHWIEPPPGWVAIMFGALTATRVSEFLYAKWSEFDLENNVWTIPAERMKQRREHRVPLSRQARELLDNLPRKTAYLFPGRYSATLALDTPRVLLVKWYKGKVTMHGCRATFRNWCAETAVPWDLAELSLSHLVGGSVERAYNRTDQLERRREVMQAWADALFELPKVVQ